MSSTPAPSPAPVPSLKEQLVREACAMVRHLVTNGGRVPASVIQSVDEFETALQQNRRVDMTALAGTHERLSRLVSPAKPGTLYLLDFTFHQRGREPGSLGPIKLVQQLVRVAMVCVAVFIALSVVALVDATAGVDIFNVELARGQRPHAYHESFLVIKIVLERVFWLSAAGIGASFAMLFILNDQIVSSTYDPDETPSYWVKFFLGVVAGFILVALIPMDHAASAQGATSGTQALGPPTVALLGGFSASAVYRILTRMVEALESVFTGSAKEQVAAAEKAVSSRAAEEGGQARMAIAGQLVSLQQQLTAGLGADEAAAQLKQVVAALVPSSVEFMPTPPPTPTEPGAAEPGDPGDSGDSGDSNSSGKVPALAVVSAPEDADTPTQASGEQPRTGAAPAPAAAG